MNPNEAREPRDDVDRLFSRLQSVAPPPDLKASIMRALPAQAPAAPQRVAAPPATAKAPATPLPWRWIATGAGLVLLLMSLRLGTLLDDSGALSVLGLIASNFGEFMGAPGDYLAPLAAELPWPDIFVALAALVTFWYSSSALIGPNASQRPQQRVQ